MVLNISLTASLISRELSLRKADPQRHTFVGQTVSSGSSWSKDTGSFPNPVLGSHLEVV